ncbi:MAG: glycosyltransferase family 1 protein [Elusimicrobiota bacterium]
MRIAIEEPLHGGGRGGVSVYTRHLIHELSRLDPGDEYHLFAYFFRDYAAKRARLAPPDGARYRLMIPRWPESAVSLFEWRLGLPCIGAYLRLRGVDLLHAHRIPRRRLLPTVTTVYDLFPVVHPEWTTPYLTDLWNSVLKPGMDRVDKVIAISEHTKKDLVERWNVKPERIEVILWGVDRSRFRPLEAPALEVVRSRYGLPARYLLMIGPFDPWCDPANSIRALAALPDSLADTHLVMAGQPGACHDAARRLIEDAGLAGRVRWLGHVPQDDLVGLYNLADALVFASYYEGFGLPVLEAMACGTPVVTSNVTSLPEVAADAALLVAPDDVDGLRDALRRVLDDDALRRTLRDKGLRRAASATWEKTARDTLAVYRSLS